MDYLDHIEKCRVRYPFMSSALDDIAECYRQCGCPAEPYGPSTSVLGLCDLATGESMGDTTDEQVYLYRQAEIALFEACGFTHVGGSQWVTQYASDDKWDEYRFKACEIATQYHADCMWDDFCNWAVVPG